LVGRAHRRGCGWRWHLGGAVRQRYEVGLVALLEQLARLSAKRRQVATLPSPLGNARRRESLVAGWNGENL